MAKIGSCTVEGGNESATATCSKCLSWFHISRVGHGAWEDVKRWAMRHTCESVGTEP